MKLFLVILLSFCSVQSFAKSILVCDSNTQHYVSDKTENINHTIKELESEGNTVNIVDIRISTSASIEGRKGTIGTLICASLKYEPSK